MKNLAESNLTKEIKRALRNYAPKMPSNNRTVRWAEEVDVGTGFVDVIRFEDYVESTRTETGCTGIKPLKSYCETIPDCKKCYLWGKANIKTLGIATTCFEVKISKSDFKSKNGHNFVGNFNYYVIPKALYPQIKGFVPDDIGVILYCGHGYLRKKKECEYKEVDKGELSRYLYNSLKKWCDMNVFMLEKFIETGNM